MLMGDHMTSEEAAGDEAFTGMFVCASDFWWSRWKSVKNEKEGENWRSDGGGMTVMLRVEERKVGDDVMEAGGGVKKKTKGTIEKS